jgi:hypothetical protein
MILLSVYQKALVGRGRLVILPRLPLEFGAPHFGHLAVFDLI